jgi:PPOX class probable F420-dependent enzyme
VDLLERFGHARYVSLTTFRKDGSGVATPVWLAVDGDELFIVSDADAGKIKRIRRNSRVTLTICDGRGRIARDAPLAEGVARVLDETQTRKVRALIARKYLMSRLGNWLARTLRIRKKPVVGIAVTL